MSNINLKKFTFFLFFVIVTSNSAFSKIETIILYKINDQIITNIDLRNEKKFLLFLNPSLNNLSSEKINNISKDSLQNRKVKEIELTKYFDLNEVDLGKTYINNFISNMNFQNKEVLVTKLNEFNLPYSYFEKNFIVDNVWREFVFNKFKSQIKIDIKRLRKQIENQKNEIEELNLSEILFETKTDISIEELAKNIYSEINKSGFEAAASIYSISDSKNFGGNLGWIKSNQISNKIYQEINKGKEITSPIKTNNGYLIIKINKRRKTKEKVNFEDELKKLINIESQKELNKLGYIYFNKIKKRMFISES